EQVMELLKVGLAPEYLRTALLLWNEFPQKSPSDIREAVIRSHSLQGAKKHLSGKKPEEASASAAFRQPIGHRRKRKGRRDAIAVPVMELQTAEAVQTNHVVDRVPACWFAGLSLRDVHKGLKR
ncbi:hypothetical protein IID24_02065, partial [Patescibacteria group bacterium]|nr:hypothetical protein [Patescibacteria group bacterium]